MYARLKYFTRETWVSLRRNTMMTVAGVITVAVSLCVLGGSLLLTRLVDHGTQKWQNGVEFIIFMQPKAPQSQTQAVQAQLKARGVETLIHYPIPPHLSEAYALDAIPGEFPITAQAAKTHLSLPIGPHLTVAQQDQVIAALREILGNKCNE